jgi:hypothetical protein
MSLALKSDLPMHNSTAAAAAVCLSETENPKEFSTFFIHFPMLNTEESVVQSFYD